MAPEHPWPASVDDTVAVLGDLHDLGFSAGSVAVAGDSAGGALAALACLRLRDSGAELPTLQVLLYANTDLTGEHPSMSEKAHCYGLEADGIRFFNAQWVPDTARWGDAGVSPLHAPDLSGLPPALIITAEHDPLREEGEAYASRLPGCPCSCAGKSGWYTTSCSWTRYRRRARPLPIAPPTTFN